MKTEKKFLTVDEARAVFGNISIASFNRKIYDGIIPSLKFGYRRYIPAKYFDELEAQAMASASGK